MTNRAGPRRRRHDRVQGRADEGPAAAAGAKARHTYEDTWKNMAYFLKEVIPVAEKNNVVMSVHPNDPPAPISRGSAQVLNSFSRLEAAGGDGELARPTA